MNPAKDGTLKVGLAAEEYLLVTIPPSAEERKVRVYNRAGQQIRLVVEAPKEIKVNRRGWKEFE